MTGLEAFTILSAVGELVAVLDLGSNAARFALARISPGVGFEILKEGRVQTRLGSGRGRTLSVTAVDRTLEAFEEFLTHLGGRTKPRMLAVGTAAVREARNAERLLGPLRRSGVEVEVLSGEEEARLGALAARRTLGVRDALIMDLGGGSLQLTRVRAGDIAPVASLPLGAVRTTERFLRHDPPTPREMEALRREVVHHAGPVLPPGDEGPLVGLGGTVRALARIRLKRAGRRHGLVHGSRLSHAHVSAIRHHLQNLPERRRQRVAGLRAERADIILAGAIVLEEIMSLGRYRHLIVCAHGVRHGFLIRETFVGTALA